MVSESVSECQLSMREWPSIERACPESEMMVVMGDITERRGSEQGARWAVQRRLASCHNDDELYALDDAHPLHT